MDLEDHRRAIWRRRWQVVLCSLLIAGAVFARSRSLNEVYAADARLQAEPGGGTTPVQGDQARYLAATYVELLSSTDVVAAATEAAGLDLDAGEAAARLSASISSADGFLTVSATGPSPAEATALAQAAADALAASVSASAAQQMAEQLAPIDAQIEELLTALRATDEASVERDVVQAEYQAALARRSDLAAQRTDRLRVLDAAEAGGTPISPTPARDAALALIVALILNAELAVLLESISGRFSGRGDEVVRLTGLPVLTRIPHADHGDTVEALRVLRTNLLYLEAPSGVRCLGVIGVNEGVGTSFVAAGLAAATAALELPVVLVDADLRSPSIGRTFGVPDHRGLGDLRPEDDPVPLLLPAPNHPYLKILPSGTPSDDPAGLLSGRFREGFRDVVDRIPDADLIVVDTPPAGVFAETAAIAAQCDLCVVVMDRSITKRQTAVDLVESLRWVGAKPVGIVLNREAIDTPARSRPTRR